MEKKIHDEHYEYSHKARTTYTTTKKEGLIVDHKAMLNQCDDMGSFYVSISGEIEGAQLEDNNCYISYNFKAGVDWENRFGQDKGCSQYASKIHCAQPLVWSCPFNVS